MCNVIIKIVTKTIANRLKPVLPNLISDTQSAFVPGRLIFDNSLLAFELFHAMKNNSSKKARSFALKLDMSKAYDCVEWSFLKSILLRTGLSPAFVGLIMRCVSSVSYAVLVNGCPSHTFFPSRGLRQGDPLSPYLFLFCAEGFSTLLKQAEMAKLIHGARLCCRAPTVSHLFFADDSIIFGRATSNEFQQTLIVIKSYCDASGQLVNFKKFEVVFSKGVSEELASSITRETEIQAVQKIAVYLGMLAHVGRSKKSLFVAVEDRVAKKLKNWKARSLSIAGKMILIKSVAQAIPIYLMSCLLIPSGTCQKLNSLVSNFWWGQRNSERRIHWVSWDRVCQPKNRGGLRFRDFNSFNIALLDKQSWRILTQGESLLTKSLQARYFPRISFMEAKLGYNPSYVWRSILAGRELISQGVRWNVRNGRKICIWTDPWVPNIQNFRVPRSHNALSHICRVSDLIVDWSWKKDLVCSIFPEEVSKNILTIPLVDSERNDCLMWNFSKDGKYSAKSGYRVAMSMKDAASSNPSTLNLSPTYWNWLWKIQIPPPKFRCLFGNA